MAQRGAMGLCHNRGSGLGKARNGLVSRGVRLRARASLMVPGRRGGSPGGVSAFGRRMSAE